MRIRGSFVLLALLSSLALAQGGCAFLVSLGNSADENNDENSTTVASNNDTNTTNTNNTQTGSSNVNPGGCEGDEVAVDDGGEELGCVGNNFIDLEDADCLLSAESIQSQMMPPGTELVYGTAQRGDQAIVLGSQNGSTLSLSEWTAQGASQLSELKLPNAQGVTLQQFIWLTPMGSEPGYAALVGYVDTAIDKREIVLYFLQRPLSSPQDLQPWGVVDSGTAPLVIPNYTLCRIENEHPPLWFYDRNQGLFLTACLDIGPTGEISDRRTLRFELDLGGEPRVDTTTNLGVDLPMHQLYEDAQKIPGKPDLLQLVQGSALVLRRSRLDMLEPEPRDYVIEFDSPLDHDSSQVHGCGEAQSLEPLPTPVDDRPYPGVAAAQLVGGGGPNEQILLAAPYAENTIYMQLLKENNSALVHARCIASPSGEPQDVVSMVQGAGSGPERVDSVVALARYRSSGVGGMTSGFHLFGYSITGEGSLDWSYSLEEMAFEPLALLRHGTPVDDDEAAFSYSVIGQRMGEGGRRPFALRFTAQGALYCPKPD